jgi:hypothetical protein
MVIYIIQLTLGIIRDYKQAMQDIFAPYHVNHYRNRRIDLCYFIKSTDVMAGFLDELLNTNMIRPIDVELKGGRIRTPDEAGWVLKQLNTTQSRFTSLINIQSQGYNWQQWTALASNLGKGFIFMFLCDGCEASTRNLYMPDGQFRYMCRRCHRLSYPTKQQKFTMIKRMEINQTTQTGSPLKF